MCFIQFSRASASSSRVLMTSPSYTSSLVFLFAILLCAALSSSPAHNVVLKSPSATATNVLFEAADTRILRPSLLAHLTMGSLLETLKSQIFLSEPRDGLHPIPNTVPLTLGAAAFPPLVYYIALLLLAPPPPSAVDRLSVKLLRSILALLAGYLFFRLPLTYYVPQSIGLTYQLGLVGLYGGCRVLDAFFISPYIFGHIPRRVTYEHRPRPETPVAERSLNREKAWSDGGVREPYTTNGSARKARSPADKPTVSSFAGNEDTSSRRGSIVSSINESYFLLSRTLTGPDPMPVYETARTEPNWPHSFVDRAAWALELELSMRGVGFTWTTADVRHTRRTWLPTVNNRIHSILVHVTPNLLVCWVTIRYIYTTYLFEPSAATADIAWRTDFFDERLPLVTQLTLTAALGAFLMSSFSLGHSLFAIMLSPLAPSPLAFFPPLYTTRVWDVTSVRAFWSYGWHRLFARLFLVYGVWPGEWIERKLTGKTPDQPADIGKVLGGFGSSAFVHSFAVRGVLAGDWTSATGEAKFFALNGLAVVVEGLARRVVRSSRRNRGNQEKMWYDAWIGRAWWITVLLWTGRQFARGWVRAGLVREMAFM